MDRNLLELLCLELPQISMVCWSLLNTLALDFIPSMSLMSFVLPGLLLKMAGVVSLVQERVPHSWTSVYVLSVGKASKLVLIVWWCLMWYVCCWNFWTKYSFAICCTQYIYTHSYWLLITCWRDSCVPFQQPLVPVTPEMDMIGLDDPFWHLINEFGISPSSFHLSHPTLGVSWMNEEEFNFPALQGCMD